MMAIELITLLIVAALFTLMAIGVPLGASTLLISVTTAYLAFGTNGFILVSSAVTKVMDKQALIAVPFFVFMANIMERSGVARELFNSMAPAVTARTAEMPATRKGTSLFLIFHPPREIVGLRCAQPNLHAARLHAFIHPA